MAAVTNRLSGLWRHRAVTVPLAMFLILISVDYFRSFPLQRTLRLTEALVVVLLLGYGAWTWRKSRSGSIALPPEATLLLLLVVAIPLVSAVSCRISYGQPVWIGLLAERRWAFCITGLFLFHRLRDGGLKPTDVRDLFAALAIVTLVVYGIILAWWDLHEMRFLWFVAMSPAKGYSLRMDMLFPAWAVLYLMAGAMERSGRDMIRPMVPAAVLWAFIFFVHKDRGLAVALTVALGGILLFERGWRKGLRVGAVGIALLLILSGLLYLVRPGMVRTQFRALEKLAATLTRTGEDRDPSTNARLRQISIAWKEITRSPRTILLGNGRLSRQWEGGYRKRFGYFFPIDMGWVGAWYMYGLLGLVIVCLPFLLVWKRVRRAVHAEEDDTYLFWRSLWWLAVLLMIYSLKNGNPAIRPAQIVTVMFLMAALDPSDRREPVADAAPAADEAS